VLALNGLSEISGSSRLVHIIAHQRASVKGRLWRVAWLQRAIVTMGDADGDNRVTDAWSPHTTGSFDDAQRVNYSQDARDNVTRAGRAW
jgi:hypothetical protein